MQVPVADNVQPVSRVEYPYWDGLNMVYAPSVSKAAEPRWCLNMRSPQVGSLETREGRTKLLTGSFGLSRGMARFDETTVLDSASYLQQKVIGFGKYLGSLRVFTLSKKVSDGTYEWQNRYDTGGDPTEPAVCDVVDRFLIAAFRDDVTLAIPREVDIAYNTTYWDSLVEDFENPIYGAPYKAATVAVYNGRIWFGDITLRFTRTGKTSTFNGTTTVTVASTAGLEPGMIAFSTPTTSTKYFDGYIVSIDSATDFTWSEIPATAAGSKTVHYGTSLTTTKRYPNALMSSSMEMGIVTTVNGDFETGSTTVEVLDTTYIRDADELEVWRGDNYIGNIAVTAVNDTNVTVSATSFPIESSDQLWVKGTRSGELTYRWPNLKWGIGSAAGTYVIKSGKNGSLTMLSVLGNSMVIGTQDSLTLYNGVSFIGMSYGIGCPSRKGWVKSIGGLYFMSYNGIYRTSGAEPELISLPVKPLLENLTKAQIEGCWAERHGDSVFFFFPGTVNRLSDDGTTVESLVGTCIEYDIRQQNFYVHSDIPYTSVLETDVNGKLELLGTVLRSGSTEFEDTFKTFDGDTDNGDSISWVAERPPVYPNKAKERYSMSQKAHLDLLRGDRADLYVSVDDKPFHPVKGQFRKGISTIDVTTPVAEGLTSKGKKFKFSLRGMADKKVRLGWQAFDFVNTQEVDPTGEELHGGYEREI